MTNFADRLIAAIHTKGSPCVVGLDPRVNDMPDFQTADLRSKLDDSALRAAIAGYHERIIDTIQPLVPAVKLQIAFYEQYGIAGMLAFRDTIEIARDRQLIVLVDAKRNDIASTAEAYANAYLGATSILGSEVPQFDVDAITVSPFLGRDSLEPFVHACREYDKGIFILVKTSNPGSVDVQDKTTRRDETISHAVGRLVDDLGRETIGASGYSSIGAVVGATFPGEARTLRSLMRNAIFLVPGYGAQGGDAAGAAASFNEDGLGALVNASRSVTYFSDPTLSEGAFVAAVATAVGQMTKDVSNALKTVAISAS